jgi:hypothetical protein
MVVSFLGVDDRMMHRAARHSRTVVYRTAIAVWARMAHHAAASVDAWCADFSFV